MSDFFYELMTIVHGACDPEKARDLVARIFEAGVKDGLLRDVETDAARWRKLESDLASDMEGKIIDWIYRYPKDTQLASMGPDSVDMTVTVKRVAKRELCIRWIDEDGKTRTLTDCLDEGIKKAKADK